MERRTVKNYILILVLNFMVCIIDSKYSFLATCSRNDPNINKCILEKAAIVIPRILKGIPEAHIPRLDPFYIDTITLQAAKDLTITAKDIYVYGLDTYKYLDVKADLQKREAKSHFQFDNITLMGEYQVDGKLSVLNLSGISGPILIIIDKLDVNVTISWDFYERKHKIYTKITNVDFVHKFEKIHVDLKNIFGKNDALGKDVNTMLNENWQRLAKEFDDAVQQAVGIILERINDIIKYIPYEEIFPDTT